MPKALATSMAGGLAVLLVGCGTGQGSGSPLGGPDLVSADGPYLSAAHSHNDYERSRPLTDALSWAFASIEVDIALRDGELYVTHDPAEIDERVTLRQSYLDPLRSHMTRSGERGYGRQAPPLQLLVDVKTEGDETFAALHEVLGDYSDILTRWESGRRIPGRVTVVVSGNRPAVGALAAERIRYAALDGRVLDDREGVSPELMPLVSEDWERLGPPDREARLRRAEQITQQIRAEGRKVRFWATPEDEGLWQSLTAMGVDYIGTDQVVRLGQYLRNGSGGSGSAAGARR